VPVCSLDQGFDKLSPNGLDTPSPSLDTPRPFLETPRSSPDPPRPSVRTEPVEVPMCPSR